mmetsp:Transcript_44881/g.108924  ORF Transcript_44881/g.108924 Transcript_44881/m.108924 type:complete len:867 (+) Transcript_44881:369-2969(+)
MLVHVCSSNKSSSSQSWWRSCFVIGTVMMMMMTMTTTSNPSFVSALNFPTPQPTEQEGVFCLICKGGDMSMGTGSISGFLCQDLDMMGRERMFTQERCVELQTRAAQDDDPCGCHPSSPVPTAQPSPAPSPLPTPAPTPTLEGLFPCDICAGNGVVTDPSAFLFSPLGDIVTCGQVAAEGNVITGSGLTPPDCLVAQSLARGTCGCSGELTPAPAPAPVTASPTVKPNTVFCTVCSNGNPAMGAGSIGGELCQKLDRDGRDFTFNADECFIIQTAASVAEDDPCECADPTPRPTTPPTPLPTPDPTPAPTALPSASPTVRPTPEPTATPTVAPTAAPTTPPTLSPTAPPTAPPTENNVLCNICGPAALGDITIGNPFAPIFQFDPPDSMIVTCQAAQTAALMLSFDTQQCLVLQLQATNNGLCGCPQDITMSPTPAPPSPAPTTATGGEFCLICDSFGNGMPSNPGGLIGSITCAEANQNGLDSVYDFETCVMLQIRAGLDDPCGCMPPTAAPTSAPTPTAIAPTDAPATIVTAAPSVDPREVCNLCGLNEPALSDPLAFIVPAIGLTCGVVQDEANDPGLTPEDCTLARIVAIPICGCRAASFLPTPSPVTLRADIASPGAEASAAVAAEVAETVAEGEEKSHCTVCYNGQPTTSNAFLGDQTCAELDETGRRGEFTEIECVFIRIAAAVDPLNGCGCQVGNVPVARCEDGELQVEYTLGLNDADTAMYMISAAAATRDPILPTPAASTNVGRVCIPSSGMSDTFTFKWKSRGAGYIKNIDGNLLYQTLSLNINGDPLSNGVSNFAINDSALNNDLFAAADDGSGAECEFTFNGNSGITCIQCKYNMGSSTETVSILGVGAGCAQ